MKEASGSKVDVFMPFYLGDYFRDTGGLNAEEHGVYIQLLLRLWAARGALPYDQAKLARMTALDPARWPDVWPSIAHFFVIDAGTLKHSRVQRELDKALQLHEKRKTAGHKGGSRRVANRKQTASKAQASGQANDQANLKPSHSQSQEIPLRAPAPDPSTTTTGTGVRQYTGHTLLRLYGEKRAEHIEGALPWDVPTSTGGKADSFAEQLTAEAAVDVPDAMDLHFTELTAGRGKSGALENPTFGFGCWMADLTRLREKIHGKTPTRPDDSLNGGPRFGADAVARAKAQQLADQIAARSGG